jgi:ABC-type transporter Mla MlaB component
MEAIQNRLHSNGSAFEEQKLITKGYFKLNKSGSKVTLKLKGDFNNTNINCVNSSMKMINSLRHRHFELDLSEVETITMQAMALLIINLKMLEENGLHTKATGLDRGKLKLANELGMHFITRTE